MFEDKIERDDLTKMPAEYVDLLGRRTAKSAGRIFTFRTFSRARQVSSTSWLSRARRPRKSITTAKSPAWRARSASTPRTS